MVVRVTTATAPTVTKFATATTATLLLYTALAAPAQGQPLFVDSRQGGCESMFVNTAKQVELERIVDESVINRVKFNRLANEWKRERGALSTAAAMAALPSYRKIMGMGKDALPFIFAELKAEGESPSHWFLALAAITDENPVPAESRGKLSEMAKAWLAWGQEAGYVE